MMKLVLQRLGRRPGPAALDPIAEPEQERATRLGRIVERGNSADCAAAPGAPQAKVKRIFRV